MREVKSSIWSDEWKDYWRVIPINTTLKTDGSLVMGAGLAKQAAERYKFLPKKLGDYYSNKPASILYSYEDLTVKLIAFPTKIYWSRMSDLGLIEKGLADLKVWTDELELESVSYKIICPRLGCGLGQLDWVKDVKPLMLKYFDTNDNFIVASL